MAESKSLYTELVLLKSHGINSQDPEKDEMEALIERINEEKEYLEREMEDLTLQHEELLDNLEFKDKEIAELQQRNEELEMQIERMEDSLEGRGNGRYHIARS